MNDASHWLSRKAELCLAPGVTNFNAGTCWPTAKVTLEAVLDVTRRAAADPVDVLFREAGPRMEAGRRAIASLLGADALDLVLLSNTSYAVNTILRSLDLASGDEIVTTDQEYVQYLPLLRRLEREQGVKVLTVPLPRDDQNPGATAADVVKAFRAKLSPRTKALFFSHVTSPTGTVLPAGELAMLARDHGALSIIDGAHAPGQIPVSLAQIAPDFYAANLHKWMMAATGSACLFVRRDRRALIKPLMTMSGYEYPSEDADRPIGEDGPTRWILSHEYQGTRPLAPLMTLDVAAGFYARIAAEGAQARMRALAARCRSKLSELGLVPVTPRDQDLCAAMVAFHYPSTRRPARTDAMWRMLRRDHGFEVVFPYLNGDTPLLRISNAWFNTEEEQDRLGTLVRRVPWD